MSGLPEEIELAILVRLPVKSLLRCKCVCKPWYKLISDPDFVKQHLNVSIQKKNCSIMIGNDEYTKVYSISYDSLSSASNGSHLADVATEMALPCELLKHNCIELLASCHGLVFGWNDQLERSFLWNPATKEYKRLPKSEFEFYVIRGFGYDYKTDDYKFVKIHMICHAPLVEVYSLKSNSWRCSDIPIHYVFLGIGERSGVISNGALHWLGRRGKVSSPKTIVSFDLSEERLEEQQPPMTLQTDGRCIRIVGVLEGCLCLLVKFEYNYEVWVMQEYGVKESWTKLYALGIESTISDSLHARGTRTICDSFYLMGSLTNGEILFKDPFCCDRIIIYYPKYGTVRGPSARGLKLHGAVSCFESLVPLNAITAVDEGNIE